jgi:hypothetical protein
MPPDMTYIPTFVLQIVMNMAEDDPRRMDEIRKYAAIYGRFDCKRKPEKPLTLHEVSRTASHVFCVVSTSQVLATLLLITALK